MKATPTQSSHKPTSGEEVGKWTLLLMKKKKKKDHFGGVWTVCFKSANPSDASRYHLGMFIKKLSNWFLLVAF